MPLDPRQLDVYALLRALLDYVPGPRSGGASTSGFTAAASRYETCPDCLANGRVLVGCETCHGRGEVYVGGPDPYARDVEAPFDPRRTSPGFGGLDREERRAAQRANAAAERRLEEQAAIREGEIAVDAHVRLVEARDRHYARGSIGAVAIALARLREIDAAAYSTAWRIALDPPVLEHAIGRRAERAVQLLAELVPDPVVLPAGVVRSRDAELERIAAAGHAALWRGRSSWADVTRGQRDALVVAYVDAGMSTSLVAWRFGLTRRRVQQLVAAARERDAGRERALAQPSSPSPTPSFTAAARARSANSDT